MSAATIDHLVVAADTLEEGAEQVERLLGVPLQPGGKHERMGTHNRLLKLGPKLYLEVIAIDPGAVPAEDGKPFQARWFDLDSPAMRTLLSEGPHLVTWAVRTDDIEALAARCPEPLGKIHLMRRGGFEWKITIPEDGHLPGGGLIPTLIQWLGDRHPADELPDRGCSLEALGGTHGAPEGIRRALAALGLTGSVPVSYGAAERLSARIRTPLGARIL